MFIPETRWTHGIDIGIRRAGATLVIGNPSAIVVVGFLRWPWATPIHAIDIDSRGREYTSRLLWEDWRDDPVDISQISITVSD